MSQGLPIYKVDSVTVRCEMCQGVMTVRKMGDDGECQILASGRNVVVTYMPDGKMGYAYVCDVCLGGGVGYV
jgi:hypothetical protein